jgi:hypothetical protein
MDFWNMLVGIGGLVLGFLGGILIPIAIYMLSVARKPQIHFEGNGILCRCLIQPVFHKGWGIISLTGRLRASHKPVTIVDAEFSYKMDESHIRPSTKFMGETFPPLYIFSRVANDERGSTVSLPRRGFTTIRVVPGEGERQLDVQFTLGGNFAEEYSEDFFTGVLSMHSGMFIPMMVRFQYEHNGKFHWTKHFDVLVVPYANMGWTSDGPKYIDEKGRIVEVRYGAPVYQS